jgi:hypothetical protein
MPFPISCGACGATFNIPDDIYERRVAGRVVNIRCKQCKTDILVDGTARALSRPPPPVDQSPRPAPQTPAAPVAEQVRAEPSAATTGLDSGAFAGSQRASPSPLQASGAAGAALAQIREESVRPAPGTSEASGPAQTDTAHLGSPRAGVPLAETASAAVTSSAGVPRRAESHAEESPLNEQSRQAPEEHAAPKVAPPSQNESEQLAPLAAPADLWAVSFGDDDDRELTETQIAEEARRGNLRRDMLVWRDGMDSWLPLGRVPELAGLLPPEEASGDHGDEAPPQANAGPAMPPPLARTTLGVGPVPVAQAAAVPAADDPVATPVLSVAGSPGAPGGEAAATAPVPAAPLLAPPPIFAPVVEPSAAAPQQVVPNPFMDNAPLAPARVQAGAPVQSAPPARPVSFELEALPPVKRGRPVLWMTAIVLVVALAVVIGLMTSWTSSEQAVPSVVPPSSSTPAMSPPTVGTVVRSPQMPAQASGSAATPPSRVDLFAPPGTHARPATGAAKSEPRKRGSRKPDLADVFADKLQGKGPKR